MMAWLRNRPPGLVRAAKVACFFGILALLWASVDVPAAVGLLQSADPRWLIAAAVALTLQTLLSAQRWRVTAAQLGLTIPPMTALREYYLAQTVNQSLPGGVLGDAGRAVRSRDGAGLLVAGQAVLFERLAGQIGLLVVLTVALAVSLLSPSGVAWPAPLVVPLAILLGALVLLSAVGVLMVRSRSPSDTKIGRFFAAFLHALTGRGVATQQAVLSIATAMCNVAAFAFCAAAIGADLSVVVAATLVPLILFAMVLPLSIAGWGLREGAAALLFPLAGATASEGLAASVAFGLIFLLATLPGLVLTWMRPNAPVLGPR